MRTTWLIVVLAACVVLSSSVLPFVAVGGVRPDPFLLFALAAALKGRRGRALFAAWTAGLAKDLASQGPLGVHAGLFALCAAALLQVRPGLNTGLLRVQCASGAAGAAACNGFYAAGLLAHHPEMGLGTAAQHAALAVGLGGLLLPLVAGPAERLLRFLNVAPRPGFGTE